MKLKELCAAAGIVCPAAAEETEIRAIVSHSAQVSAGCLFVCLRGTRTDGHQYAAEAAAGGAVAILCEGDVIPEVGEGVILLRTDNTRRALAFLYDAWYGYPSRRLRLIAVTGTNGKTSVTFMIKRILEAAMLRCGLIGTVRCYCGDRVLRSQSDNELANMTTPDPRELYRLLSEMAEAGVDFVVMEATSHALAFSKLAPLRFEVAVFTNLTPEHLDFHGDMNAYFEAKRSLFTMCRHAVINVDDSYGRALAQRCECAVTTCAVEAPEGYAYVRVTAGISDEEYVEILSGLQEGDTVAYTLVTSNLLGFLVGGNMPGMMGGAQ